ncbi:MAG: hypothetical protein R2800_15420 [Flavipsychrobacter sp.]
MYKKMAILAGVCGLLLATPAMAQQRGDKGPRHRDPKQMTEQVAKRMNFTDEQKAQLKTLNQEFSGDDYDRKAYHEGFKKILTTEQKEALEQRRMKMGDRRGQHKPE